MSGVQKNRLSLWKGLRWAITALMVIALALMLKRPAAAAQPFPDTGSSQDNQRFQSKWSDLELAHQRGEQLQARFTADEVNAALEYPGRPGHISFAGDQVTGEFIADLHGKSVYVTVSGKLAAADGYLTFEPVQLKIGDLPVPVSVFKAPLENRLSQPEIRERLRLPEYIADLRIRGGELIVVAK